MRIAVIGRTRALLESAKLLHSNGFSVPLVVTSKAAEHYRCSEEEFGRFAETVGAKFLCTPAINGPSAFSAIRNANCDIAISVNWVNIVEQPVIDQFKYGILNAHAGDLPKYRGNAPVNWAILAGEQKVALSIHQMQAGELDSGDICSKYWFEMSNGEDYEDFDRWFMETTPKAFLSTIQAVQAGRVEKQAQSVSQKEIIRCFPRQPEDSRIDWRCSAVEIERLIRASTRPLSGAFCSYRDFRSGNSFVLRIWKAKATLPNCRILAIPGQIMSDPDTGSVSIVCGDGTLELLEYSFDSSVNGEATQVLRKSVRNRLV